MTRSPDGLLALIIGMDVSNNAAFSPRYGNSYCNCYAVCMTAAMGVPLPSGRLANELAEWLPSSAGVTAGWKPVLPVTALEKSNAGCPVVAVLHEMPHGHIAICVPSPQSDKGHQYVSAAGKQCFVRTVIENSFGNSQPTFFAND